MSVLAQMETLIGNQERKLSMWEFTGLWWLQDQIKYEAQREDSVWLSHLKSTLCPFHRTEAEPWEIVNCPGYTDDKHKMKLGHLTCSLYH